MLSVFQMAPCSLYCALLLKKVHYIGNKVPFGIHMWSYWLAPGSGGGGDPVTALCLVPQRKASVGCFIGAQRWCCLHPKWHSIPYILLYFWPEVHNPMGQNVCTKYGIGCNLGCNCGEMFKRGDSQLINREYVPHARLLFMFHIS